MNEVRVVRERHFWIAVVAVLATSLVWLAAVNLVLILHSWSGGMPVALRVARVLFRVGASLVGHAGPVIPAALVVLPAVALVLWAPRGTVRREPGAHHA